MFEDKHRGLFVREVDLQTRKIRPASLDGRLPPGIPIEDRPASRDQQRRTHRGRLGTLALDGWLCRPAEFQISPNGSERRNWTIHQTPRTDIVQIAVDPRISEPGGPRISGHGVALAEYGPTAALVPTP